MEHTNIKKIDRHLEYIVLNMDTKRTLDHLLSTSTLTNPVYTRIMRIPYSDDANRELVEVLKKTSGAYGKFISALHNTQQYQLVQTLQATENNAAHVASSSSTPASTSNSGAQLRDIYGGTVHINIAHGNMHTSGASGQL
uniref:CARD domain-containing protein n=1 Tax=Plectus sambesii TaxID=2011161 RepID=A0A914X6B3_9BILA